MNALEMSPSPGGMDRGVADDAPAEQCAQS